MKTPKEVGDLIASKRAMLKMTQSELAMRINATQRMVSRWENGKIRLKGLWIDLIAKELQLDPSLLKATADEIDDDQDILKTEEQSKNNDPLSVFLKRVPVVGTASAGYAVDLPPSQVQETLYDVIGSLPQNLMAVRVNGDSMQTLSDRSICDGDYALVDASRKDPSQLIGKIVCARLDGEEHLIKQLILANGAFYLRSFNQSYPALLVHHESARIEGEVVLIVKRI